MILTFSDKLEIDRFPIWVTTERKYFFLDVDSDSDSYCFKKTYIPIPNKNLSNYSPRFYNLPGRMILKKHFPTKYYIKCYLYYHEEYKPALNHLRNDYNFYS